MPTKDQWKAFWGVVLNAAGILGLVGVVVGGSWYFFRLDDRVATVEAQIQALALAPTLVRKGSEKGNFSAPVPNPLLATCAQLALKVADAYQRGTPITEAYPIEKMMARLGCEGKARTVK